MHPIRASPAIAASAFLVEIYLLLSAVRGAPNISGRTAKIKVKIAAVITASPTLIARCIGSIRRIKVVNGSCVIPEAVVSKTTPKAPSCKAITTETEAARIIFPRVNPLLRIFLYTNGNTIRAGITPMLKILAPNAKIPPSAKISDCIISTDVMAKRAAYGPNTAAKRMLPTICPLEPVNGTVKFNICNAKTKAPITAMRGIFPSREKCAFSCSSLFNL
jgi:hypothetical protein